MEYGFESKMAAPREPDYGVDAPPVIWTLGVIGVAGLVGGVALVATWLPWRAYVAWPLWTLGVICSLEASLMILYAKWGKFRHRERILARVSWRGDEQVLDVGTGRGLLLIGAAKRVPRGRAVGIDIWNAQDLSRNAPEHPLANASLEGVRDRVEVRSEDARKLSFPDASFDVVLSNLCLHNIPDAAGRAQACAEIARVLKPGGRAVVSDFKNTARYASELERAGLTVRRGNPQLLDTFPPLTVVEATKPEATSPPTPRG